jgi:hypothetical protein
MKICLLSCAFVYRQTLLLDSNRDFVYFFVVFTFPSPFSFVLSLCPCTLIMTFTKGKLNSISNKAAVLNSKLSHKFLFLGTLLRVLFKHIALNTTPRRSVRFDG